MCYQLFMIYYGIYTNIPGRLKPLIRVQFWIATLRFSTNDKGNCHSHAED
jgi:hypothetical protein